MSESEVERLARLEARMDQCLEMADLVKELKSALDQIRGGSKVFYITMAACGALGGMVSKYFTWGGSH